MHLASPPEREVYTCAQHMYIQSCFLLQMSVPHFVIFWSQVMQMHALCISHVKHVQLQALRCPLQALEILVLASFRCQLSIISVSGGETPCVVVYLSVDPQNAFMLRTMSCTCICVCHESRVCVCVCSLVFASTLYYWYDCVCVCV